MRFHYHTWSFLFQKFHSFLIQKFLPNHHYYRPLKSRPNHHYYRPQKIKKIAGKKMCEIKKKIRGFPRKCLKNSSKGTRNNQKKISNSIREIFKIHDFFRFSLPVHPPSTTIHHPSVKTSWLSPGTPEGQSTGLNTGTAAKKI